ncbi:SET and MYND domain-containing protein 4 isoform X1 [Glossina fuscipes]|uniref:SET and MYND domain-containing protein 4 isoform X1 n=1 Tax=Glossina fuscipes TaxID=7396 RepID=A0A9C5Z4X5_9MUSC|nr:SET and MYND domain-containing protein 4 isoform X1 [Glossina fuscipes]
MDSKWLNFLLSQLRLVNYENEYETMRLLFDKPLSCKLVCKSAQDLLESLKRNENYEFLLKDKQTRVREAANLRKEGNDCMAEKEKPNKVLEACRLYTDAIFTAIGVDNMELSLGYANRALALQCFGYYQQAYDDCECALEIGYPKKLYPKIICRQAYCALQLNNAELLTKHLSSLESMHLNENFRRQEQELRANLWKLQNQTEKTNGNVELILKNRDSQEIVNTFSEIGRYMRAKRLIKQNELIFSERATALAPIGSAIQLCNHCAKTSFIPIPCQHCRGRVVYCSLACLKAHKNIHLHECSAYQMQLFAHVGIAHLALRIILDNGLLTILDLLRNKQTTKAIWTSLTEGGDVWSNPTAAYSESLRMVSHLKKMALEDVKVFAAVSHLIVVYLSRYTSFFDLLSSNHRFNCNWELIVAALILKHIGQSIVNGHVCTVIRPKIFENYSLTEYHLLNEDLWEKPWHLRRGYLHRFAYIDDVATLNLPYTSICNHSCLPLFQPKFSGRIISAYAMRDIKESEEITNCYTQHSRVERRQTRQEILKKSYHFICKCGECMRQEGDDDVNQFHQYRCDNEKCRHVFVPQTPLKWWQRKTSNDLQNINVLCAVCGSRQMFKWFYDYQKLLTSLNSPLTRLRLYQLYQNLDEYLLAFNSCKAFMASKAVQEIFKFLNDGSLNEEDYKNLTRMIKYSLEYETYTSGSSCISYICEMTYLWDIIALGKWKYEHKDMNSIFNESLIVLGDEMFLIFSNYYKDFLVKS